MNELERLKNKNYVQAFGLMSPEEQECMRKAGKKNCLAWTIEKEWKVPPKYNFSEPFSWATTYAIKPNYSPDPEYVDLEIKKDKKGNGWLGIEKTDKIDFPFPFDFLSLHCLPDLEGFVEFWYESAQGCRITNVTETSVASRRYEKKTVYARFRK